MCEWFVSKGQVRVVSRASRQRWTPVPFFLELGADR